MRRIAVLVASAALLVAAAAPAYAQSASISGISNGQSIVGSVTIRGHAGADPGTNVRHLELIVDGAVARAEDYSGIQATATIEYGWGTSALRNGEYAITVNASFSGGGSATDTYRVYVDNPPAAPSGISASNNSGTVTVSWSPNPEADISGYRLERDSGAGWTSVGQTYNTSMSDQPGPGAHSYRVIALRYSPTQGTKASAPSGAASVSVAASGGNPGAGAGYYDQDGYYQGGSGNGNGGGPSVPGYGGGTKGAKGPRGAGGKGGGDPWNLVFAGGRSIGGLGLPGGLTLPGSGTGLSPRVQDSIDWGTYSEELPYALGSGTGGITPEEFLGERTAARWDYRVIPPDGLRWVAAGLLLMVVAALLMLVERRIPIARARRSSAVVLEAGTEGGGVSLRTSRTERALPVEEVSVEGASVEGDGFVLRTRKSGAAEDDAA